MSGGSGRENWQTDMLGKVSGQATRAVRLGRVACLHTLFLRDEASASAFNSCIKKSPVFSCEKRLYKRLLPSVRRSVRPSVTRFSNIAKMETFGQNSSKFK